MADAGSLWVENIANVIMDSLENFDTLCVKIGPLWHAMMLSRLKCTICTQ